MTFERPGHPHAKSNLARFLDKRIDELRGVKTQREIATESGFKRPNILSMLKTGETQLALDRVPAVARALEADPAHVFRLAMLDRWPKIGSVIDEVFGRRLASANEEAVFLTKWRLATGDSDPAPNARIDAAVDAMISELVKK